MATVHLLLFVYIGDRSGTLSRRWWSTNCDPISPSSLPPLSCRTARASAGPTTEASCTPGEFFICVSEAFVNGVQVLFYFSLYSDRLLILDVLVI